jgi:hypothetical protein
MEALKLTNNKQEIPTAAESLEGSGAISPAEIAKKAFVEPEISSPVDVLEATTFFQFTDSGATN